MDSGEPLESLFSIGDTKEGWPVVCRFLMALERSGLASLKEKPIEIGGEGGGKNGWVIA
jgi:hypothetical protein